MWETIVTSRKCTRLKKAQLEAAYRRQQQEINELKDFVARNKARVSTRNMAMSRQKKSWTRWRRLSWEQSGQNRNFISVTEGLRGVSSLRQGIW